MSYEGPLEGYTDLAISASNVRLPASATPKVKSWLTVQKMVTFGAIGGEYVHVDTQLPHGYVEGTNLHPHVHFTNPVAIADGETVVFRLYYTIANVWSTFPSESTIDMDFVNDASTREKITAEGGGSIIDGSNNIIANSHLIAGASSDIVGSGTNMSACLAGRLERLSSDTHGSDVYLVSFDNHYQTYRLGSYQEFLG